MPLKPDYLIESRNGFHVYYLIQSSERKMSSEWWHWIERGIFNYVQQNISENVDHAVKKSNQVMRLPYSFHKKDDDSDDGYKVKIIYERKQADKILAFNDDSYDSAMFAYSTKQLIKAFEIDKEIINNIKAKNKGHTSKQICQSNEYKEIVKKEVV